MQAGRHAAASQLPRLSPRACIPARPHTGRRVPAPTHTQSIFALPEALSFNDALTAGRAHGAAAEGSGRVPVVRPLRRAPRHPRAAMPVLLLGGAPAKQAQIERYLAEELRQFLELRREPGEGQEPEAPAAGTSPGRDAAAAAGADTAAAAAAKAPSSLSPLPSSSQPSHEQQQPLAQKHQTQHAEAPPPPPPPQQQQRFESDDEIAAQKAAARAEMARMGEPLPDPPSKAPPRSVCSPGPSSLAHRPPRPRHAPPPRPQPRAPPQILSPAGASQMAWLLLAALLGCLVLQSLLTVGASLGRDAAWLRTAGSLQLSVHLSCSASCRAGTAAHATPPLPHSSSQVTATGGAAATAKGRLVSRLLHHPWAGGLAAGLALPGLLLAVARNAVLHFDDARTEARYAAWLNAQYGPWDAPVHALSLLAGLSLFVAARGHGEHLAALLPSGLAAVVGGGGEAAQSFPLDQPAAAAALPALALLAPAASVAAAAALRMRWYASCREDVTLAARFAQAAAGLLVARAAAGGAALSAAPAGGPAWLWFGAAQLGAAGVARMRASAYLPAQLLLVAAAAACAVGTAGGVLLVAARLVGAGWCAPALLTLVLDAASRRAFIVEASGAYSSATGSIYGSPAYSGSPAGSAKRGKEGFESDEFRGAAGASGSWVG
jgi:hypothetical protein